MTDLIEVDEWRRWLTSRRGRDRWRRWADSHPSLCGWSVDELADPRWTPRVDRMQHDLVALAQGGEDRAVVTLLVQLRPGLGRLVGLRAVVGGQSRAEASAEVGSVFVETVYRHRLDRRPRRIAANLILDTRQRLNRGDRWRGRLEPLPPDDLERVRRSATGSVAQHPDDGSTADARSCVWRAVAGLPGSEASRRITAEAAYRAWFLDQSHSSIAAELDLPTAAVTARLQRLRRSVRRELADPPEPAGSIRAVA